MENIKAASFNPKHRGYVCKKRREREREKKSIGKFNKHSIVSKSSPFEKLLSFTLKHHDNLFITPKEIIIYKHPLTYLFLKIFKDVVNK